MSEVPRFEITPIDEVDLLSLRLALREAELRAKEVREVVADRDVQKACDESADRRVRSALGSIAAEGCLRFEGEGTADSDYRLVKSRFYSMYAVHPDTMEQIIKAIDFMIDRMGPRYQAAPRPVRIAP